MSNEAAGAIDPGKPPSRLKWLLRKAWWLHSCFALSFGVGVMLFARAGLAYADKVMMALFVSWILMFVALRFIVGPANRRENEGLARRGLRTATNYIIKQFYQQMFFFLTPLYASSATWSLSAFNWWLAPILLVCGVVSTMDLVFDHFVMERRWLASTMYGLAMFGVINVLLPLLFKKDVDHGTALIIAAAATPASVALLSFSVRSVLSPQGALLTLGTTGALLAAVWYGREFIPPAPLAMTETAVGHGTPGKYECLPASKHRIRKNELDGLRCGSLLREPGGVSEEVEHVWTHRGHVLWRDKAKNVDEFYKDRKEKHCDGETDDKLVLTEFPKDRLPPDPTGMWSCQTWTLGGQIVGLRKFEVLTATGASIDDTPPANTGSAGSASSGSATGSAGSATP